MAIVARAVFVAPTRGTSRSAALTPALTGYGGLASFGAFTRDLGVDQALRDEFWRLKPGPLVVYPMEAQMRLLIDAAVVGEHRVFGVEALSADPLFVHLAGGVVPSLDTIYRDLRRFDEQALCALEELMATHGLTPVRTKRRPLVHLDVDSTVEPIFGEHEGALPGPNPHYHGRPSYHPILARCAETDTVVGGKLRPGDTSFGDAGAPTIAAWIDRMREATGPKTVIRVRIDAAGDCKSVMRTIHEKRAHFLIKAKTTVDLCAAIYRVPRGCWRAVDVDADGKPRARSRRSTSRAASGKRAASACASSPCARSIARASSSTCGTTPSGPCRPS
jgi:hypothetical protein